MGKPVQHARGLRIATRCQTNAQFVATFNRFCEDAVIFIPHAKRIVGTPTAFSFDLADGSSVLCGMGTVLDEYTTPDNRFGRPGIVIGLEQLTPTSKRLHEELQIARALAESEKAERVTPAPMLARTMTSAIDLIDPTTLPALSSESRRAPSQPAMLAASAGDGPSMPSLGRTPSRAMTPIKTPIKVPSIVPPSRKPDASSALATGTDADIAPAEPAAAETASGSGPVVQAPEPEDLLAPPPAPAPIAASPEREVPAPALPPPEPNAFTHAPVTAATLVLPASEPRVAAAAAPATVKTPAVKQPLEWPIDPAVKPEENATAPLSASPDWPPAPDSPVAASLQPMGPGWSGGISAIDLPASPSPDAPRAGRTSEWPWPAAVIPAPARTPEAPDVEPLVVPPSAGRTWLVRIGLVVGGMVLGLAIGIPLGHRTGSQPAAALTVPTTPVAPPPAVAPPTPAAVTSTPPETPPAPTKPAVATTPAKAPLATAKTNHAPATPVAKAHPPIVKKPVAKPKPKAPAAGCGLRCI